MVLPPLPWNMVPASVGGRELAPPDYVMLWRYRKTELLLVKKKKKKKLVGLAVEFPIQQLLLPLLLFSCSPIHLILWLPYILLLCCQQFHRPWDTNIYWNMCLSSMSLFRLWRKCRTGLCNQEMPSWNWTCSQTAFYIQCISFFLQMPGLTLPSHPSFLSVIRSYPRDWFSTLMWAFLEHYQCTAPACCYLTLSVPIRCCEHNKKAILSTEI